MTKQEFDAALLSFEFTSGVRPEILIAELQRHGLRIVPAQPVASRVKCRRKTSDGFWTEDWQYSNQQHGDTKPLYADPAEF